MFGFLLSVSLPCIKPVQTHAQRDAEAELYRSILHAIAHKQYDEALVAGRNLIVRTNNYGQVYAKLVQAAKAAGQLEQAKAIFESLLQLSPPNPRGYYGLGLVYREKGDLAVALEYYKKCFSLQPEFSLPLLELVDTYRKDKRGAEAETYLKLLAQAYPASGVVHLALGYYYARERQVEAAVKEIDAAVLIQPSLPEACYHKALALHLGGRYSDSLTELDRCRPLVEAQLNEDEQQAFMNVTAINHYQLGSYADATNLFQQAVKFAQRMEDKGYEEVSLAYLALIYEAQDRYTEALAGYQLAFEKAQQSLSPDSAINLRRYPARIGSIYNSLGDWPTAIRYFLSGLEIVRREGDKRMQGLLLTYLGDAEAAQHNFAGAISYYKQVVELNVADPFSPGSAPDVLSLLYLRTGEYLKARSLIEQELQSARAVAEFAKELKLLNRLGDVQFRLGATDRAIEAYQKALQLAVAKHSPRQIWTACAGLAACYVRQEDLNKAKAYYLRAIEVMESVRAQLNVAEDKAAFFQDKVEIYTRFIAVLTKLSDQSDQKELAAESFYVAERARARAFSDLLAEAKVNLEQDIEPDLLKRQQAIQQRVSDLTAKLFKENSVEVEKQNKAEIARLEAELSKADSEIADLRREVQTRNPRYADLKYPQPVNLEQAKQLLLPDQVLLSYLLGEEESYLFAVSHNRYQVRKLPPAKALRESAEKLIAAIVSGPGEWRKSAESLYQTLIHQPAAQFLQAHPGARELIVVPDGALHQVPFEVLLEPSWRRATDAGKLPYLVKRYAISYAYSATVLKSLKGEQPDLPKRQKAFIVFADPQYDRNGAEKLPATIAMLRAAANENQWRFERLANSEREAKGIAGMFAKGEADLYMQEQANEQNVKTPGRLRDYRILHFSAHGMVNESRPRFSGLVLTLPTLTGEGKLPEGSEDGVLSTYEVFNLKLNADLVTLSACESGSGKEIKGEGLMSLARAFMYAGTPSVLASLWKVDDASAADLMIDFYKFWQHGKKVGKRMVKLNKAEALRQAQLNAIEAGSHPFFWAPFVLIGRSD